MKVLLAKCSIIFRQIFVMFFAKLFGLRYVWMPEWAESVCSQSPVWSRCGPSLVLRVRKLKISIWLIIFIWRKMISQMKISGNFHLANHFSPNCQTEPNEKLKIWNTYFAFGRPGRPLPSSQPGESCSIDDLPACPHFGAVISAIFQQNAKPPPTHTHHTHTVGCDVLT